MNNGSNALSSVVATASEDSGRYRSRWKLIWMVCKLALVIVTFTSVFLNAFLRFVWPDDADELAVLFLVCAALIGFLSLIALLRRRWKELALLLAALVIPLGPLLGLSFNWVAAEGFRLHGSPPDLSRCAHVDFMENERWQTVGTCQARVRYSIFETVFEAVLYDTTGELLKPVSQRTPEWKKAMYSIYSEGTLTGMRPVHLSGNFYLAAIHISYKELAAHSRQENDER